MGSFSLVHWLIFGGVLVLVLGGGRFSNLMGDVAKGIKQFKKGMADEESESRETAREKGLLEVPRRGDGLLDKDAERLREER